MDFKSSLKCKKKLGKKVRTYTSTFYLLIKLFHEKPMFFVSCVKIIRFGDIKDFSLDFILSSLH